MAGKSDHYGTLGVTQSASQDDIKRAYRKLAKKHHPDRNPGDAAAEQEFQAVQRAYDILGDKEKRSQYDRFGDAGVGSVGTGRGGERVYQWGDHSSVNVEDLQDLFSAFGGGRSGSGGTGRPSVFDEILGGLRGRQPQRVAPQRGADEERTLSLSFEQAARGAVVTVQLTSRHNGRKETLDVKIPPGVEEGQRIRLAGRGHPGRHGGGAGDFFLVCRITPHAYFTRRGADVVVEVPVSVSEASLGAKVEVPTLDGPATVTVPAGTAGGVRLRLKGRGVAIGRASKRGDQYVVVRIVPPKPLTDEQRELLVQLAAADQSDPRSQCAWNIPSKA